MKSMDGAVGGSTGARGFREGIASAVLLGISCLIGFAIVEGGLRLRHSLAPVSLGPVLELCDERGWQARRDYRFEGWVEDCEGAEHPLSLTTNADGFRVFMAPSEGRPRILFLGDSFTFSREVSDGNEYYRVAGDLLGATVVAYGSEGYNNLQAWLVLDRWLEEVQPDLIVLQVCSNDIITHTPELTRMSPRNQCLVRQPFLAGDGRIVYRNPGDGYLSALVAPSRSRVLRSMAYRLENWWGKEPVEREIEAVLAEEGGDLPEFLDAVETTGRVFDKFDERRGDIPMVVFNVYDEEPYDSAFARICAVRGIPYLTEVWRQVGAAAGAGVVTAASDCEHWSSAGHAVAGRALAVEIERLNLLR